MASVPRPAQALGSGAKHAQFITRLTPRFFALPERWLAKVSREATHQERVPSDMATGDRNHVQTRSPRPAQTLRYSRSAQGRVPDRQGW
ncbi:hypothetical protein EMIT0P44_20286 [Pseudomonas sp. IT-P44]